MVPKQFPPADRRRILQGALGLATLGSLGLAHAQAAYPGHVVRIIVPFSAGGVGDAVARLLADRVGNQLGQKFLVENRAGAGGIIGTEYVAKSPADGYTLLLTSPGFTVNPALQRDLKWDPVTDFAPIAMAVTIPNVIVVASSQPYTTLEQLLEAARRRPGEITYGSAGVGSSPHLAGELLSASARVRMVHVPYKGQSDAVTDLLSGRVTFMALTTALAVPQIEAGRLRPLAVTSARRAKSLPQVPTVAEQGIPDYEVDGWIAILAPAKTDPAIIAKLNGAIRTALGQQDMEAPLASLNCEVSPLSSPEDLGAYVRADRDKWARIIQSAGVKIQ